MTYFIFTLRKPFIVRMKIILKYEFFLVVIVGVIAGLIYLIVQIFKFGKRRYFELTRKKN